MEKIVIVTDCFITKEDIMSPLISKKLDIYRRQGYEILAVEDRTYERIGSGSEYALQIEKKGPEWVEPDAEVMNAIKDAEILIVYFSAVNKKMIDAANNLKMIGVMRSGVENINLEAARERNIMVCSCPGRVADPVADFAVGLMLTECRNIGRDNLLNADVVWKRPDPADRQNASMKNKTVGIVGFGAIGRKVAKRVQAFGSEVIAYDPYCTAEGTEDLGVQLVTLDQLCETSDIITIHARLTPDNAGLIGEKQFDLMKKDCIVINTSRAGLINEQALIAALQKGKIRSAALDVFHTEPLDNENPLKKLKNVTLTPHRAGDTSDVAANSVDVMKENLDAYIEKHVPRYAV